MSELKENKNKVQDNHIFIQDNRIWYLLIGLFVIVAGIRMYYAFHVDYFSDDDAYFTLRQAEYISSHLVPLYNDSLSYGGRFYVFLPFFHYLLALFSKFFSSVVIAKILPNIFASSLVFFIYLLVYDITKNPSISLFTSVFSSFIPVYFYNTINTISVYSLVIPLSVVLLYLFMNISNKRNIALFLILLLIFLLTHSSVIILVLSLIVYLVLMKIEDMKLSRSVIEVSLFSVFFMLWMYLLIFKNAFLKHGHSFIWENMPQSYIIEYFHQITIWQAIYQIGIIPFLLGIFITYYYLFNVKDPKVYLLISLAITTTFLLWFKLVKLDLALIYLGIVLVILFGIAYNHLIIYLKTTKFEYLLKPLFVFICVVFVLTSILPSLSLAKQSILNTLPSDQAESLSYLKDLTPSNARIAAPLNYGHAVAYFSDRRNFCDNNFLFLDNSDEIIRDIDTLYTTVSNVKAQEILAKYDTDYILFTREIGQKYGISALSFIDNDCFESMIDNWDMMVFRNKCTIVTSMIS